MSDSPLSLGVVEPRALFVEGSSPEALPIAGKDPRRRLFTESSILMSLLS